MNVSEQIDPFSVAMGKERGVTAAITWHLFSENQRELILRFTDERIKQAIYDGKTSTISQSFAAICHPAYLEFRPKYESYHGYKRGGADRGYGDALFTALNNTAGFSGALAEVERSMLAGYHKFTDCEHLPSVTVSGPWVETDEQGLTLCLKCALEKERQDISQASEWKGFRSDDDKSIVSLKGRFEIMDEESRSLDRTIFTIASSVKQDSKTRHVACEDGQGDHWYGLMEYRYAALSRVKS